MNTIQLAKILKALSNPNRLELYLEIVKKNEKSYEAGDAGCYINDIMGCLKIGAPTISHHLKELMNADLIVTERKGKFLVARANEDTMNEVNKILAIPCAPPGAGKRKK